jgi:hypothetical protein
MSKSKAGKPSKASAKKTAVQEALEVTWRLKGDLKRIQMAYLRAGALLAQVRDQKLYAALKHASLEDYAEKRLKLRRAALYRYLQIYEWVRDAHPAWLEGKSGTFIPELSDVTDLMWIERKLQEKGLSAKARTELETLRAKALDGTLREAELSEWRKRGGRAKDGLKSLLSKVRFMRRHAAEIKDVPPKALSCLDAAIELLAAAVSEQSAL